MHFGMEKGLEKATKIIKSSHQPEEVKFHDSSVVRPILEHCMPGVRKGEVSYQDDIGHCSVTMLSPSIGLPFESQDQNLICH